MPSPFSSARWIWIDEDPDQPNRWAWFRRRFSVPAGCTRARIHCCADLRYRLWVNGHLVGFGPPKYHLPHPTYDTYELAPFIRPGDNVVCFLVHSVGANQRYGSFMPRRGALITTIEVDDECVVSDATWRAARERAYAEETPRQSNHQSFVECFDARHSLGEPWTADYDDRAWPPARELSPEDFPPWERLEPRDFPHLTAAPMYPLRIRETGNALAPGDLDPLDMKTQAALISRAAHRPADERTVSIAPGLPGHGPTVSLRASTNLREGAYAVWDFGQVLSGYVFLEAEGTPGTILEVGYAEHLTDGRVDANKQTIRYADRVILGHGPLRHMVMMPKTLRFLHLEARGGQALVRKVGLLMSTFPVEWRGSFHSSDRVLDNAWEMGAYTVQLCMEDSYLDTPWRERSAWLGDAVIEARANYYTFGDTRLIRRLLDLIMRGQQPDGSISGKYPSNAWSNIPTWYATYNFALADYLLYTGDLEFARQVWPGVVRLRHWFEQHIGPSGLLENLPQKPWGNYVLVDWAPIDHRGAIAGFNAHYIQFLRDGAWLAGQIGAAEADSWRARADELATTFRRQLWSPERGLFVNNICAGQRSQRAGQHENLLAILYGIATSEQQETILRILLREWPLPIYDEPASHFDLVNNAVAWDNEKAVPAGSPYFSYYVLRALFDIGRTDDALAYLRAHWGRMAAQGANSTWESWNILVGSCSHGWSAAPTALLGEYVLGVVLTQPGFRSVDILPSAGDLTRAAGRVPTPLGIIQMEWQSTPHWKITVQVPEGMTARVGAPAAKTRGVLIVNGRAVTAQEVVLRRGRYLATTLGHGEHELALLAG